MVHSLPAENWLHPREAPKIANCQREHSRRISLELPRTFCSDSDHLPRCAAAGGGTRTRLLKSRRDSWIGNTPGGVGIDSSRENPH
jgi:hypothetical protein